VELADDLQPVRPERGRLLPNQDLRLREEIPLQVPVAEGERPISILARFDLLGEEADAARQQLARIFRATVVVTRGKVDLDDIDKIESPASVPIPKTKKLLAITESDACSWSDDVKRFSRLARNSSS